MIDYQRNIEHYLRQWKQSAYRKPLILRGARQVGKTTSVRKFAEQYRQFISLNLEKAADAKPFLEINDVNQLAEALFLLNGKNLDEPDTLLFIDEIQAVPSAINQLRYFYEEMPWLHVIAAGSLLETILDEKVNIPVGRVEYAIMRPVAFSEYLLAISDLPTYELWKRIPVADYAYDKLMDLYHTYTLIGGMPEVVRHYAQHRNIKALGSIYKNHTQSYKDDVEKYARNSTMVQTIRQAIDALPAEAGTRIKFEGFGKSNYRSREMGEALRTLQKALLLHLLYPVTQSDYPLLPDTRKSPRLQMLDTGLLNYYARLQPELILLKDLNAIQGGRIIEHITGQELLATSFDADHRLLWWTREKKQAMAEVDFVLEVDGLIIPVEVKAGATGTLRSLLVYMEELPHPFALRLYAGKLKIDHIKTASGKPVILLSLPYFLAGLLYDYAKWLMAEKWK